MANNNNDKLVSVGGLTEFRDKSTEEVAVLFEGEQQRTELTYQKKVSFDCQASGGVAIFFIIEGGIARREFFRTGNTGTTVCAGNDSRLSDARPASDVYSWAKAVNKPSYTLSEVGASMSSVAISSNTSSTCSITGSSNAGKTQTIIYTNNTSSDLTVTVPTTYTTPDGQAIELTCKAGGYCEVSYINIGGTIYARGL